MEQDEQRSLIRTRTLCLATLICVSSLCLAMFFKTYADPTVLTALISIAGTLVGALAMSKPQPQQQGNNNTTTSTTTNENGT